MEYLKFVFDALKDKRLRSWLTLIGIFIGIASVVSLIGLGEGLRVAIIGQFGFLGSDVLSVRAKGLDFAGPPGQGTVNPLSDTLVDDIKNIRYVETAFNRNIDSVRMEYNDVQQITSIVTMPSGENRKIVEMMANLKAEFGRLLKDGDGKKIVVGRNFADDEIFGKGLQAGSNVLLNGEKWEVLGILERKGSFIFDNAILMNEDIYFDFFGNDNTADVIAVKATSIDRVDQIKEDIEKLLRKERDVKAGEEDFVVETPATTLNALDDTLFAVQLFVYIIASISIVVGGVGISNTMYTAVLERTKDIGIMKSIGAKNSTIFTLFFIESGFLGFVGGLMGVLLGMSIAYGLAYVGRTALGFELIQAKVSIGLIIGALLFSFIIGTVAGVWPAYRASRLQPVESLRYAK